jgi:hypothetical protein
MRVMGSLAFVAAARTAYLVAPDPDDRARRLFLAIKNNLAADKSGLAFRIEGITIPSGFGPVETSRVMWDATPVTATADEVVRPQTPEQGSALREAFEWLQGVLSDPTPATEVFHLARKVGIAEKLSGVRRRGFAW